MAKKRNALVSVKYIQILSITDKFHQKTKRQTENPKNPLH